MKRVVVVVRSILTTLPSISLILKLIWSDTLVTSATRRNSNNGVLSEEQGNNKIAIVL
ncbi:MAG: hypothetical protein ACR2KZ_05465 [Segetibacter sp.]